MPLVSADNHFTGTGLPAGRMAEASLHPRFWGGVAPIPVAGLAAASIAVQVNDGRWLVQCPGCQSAQMASRTDRRFYCGECSNGSHGGQWVSVTWPADGDDIDTVLAARPDPTTRNWVPTKGDGSPETVADLIAENDVHSIPVPLDVRNRHGAGT